MSKYSNATRGLRPQRVGSSSEPGPERPPAERESRGGSATLALAAHFGNGKLAPRDVAAGLTGAVVRDPIQDAVVWREYLETVMKERDGWKDLYKACREAAE